MMMMMMMMIKFYSTCACLLYCIGISTRRSTASPLGLADSKIVTRYMPRPGQMSFAGVAVALDFNRQVFQSLIEVALYTSQRSNNDWNNCYPLLP